ncbi:MAG: type II toxin-antitoxin system Phd/YefM family antitoxin [Burkholderiaceae bacterium]|nr:type II toxin-antitoxin system Phd/YefM family antitoxin [Burkholderiaceae bacterium]
MQHFTSSQAKQNFGELLKAAELGPIAVERHRKVQVIVITPEHLAAYQQPIDPKAERRLARLNQSLVERNRLIRHQKIAIDLLTLPSSESAQLIENAHAMVKRWSKEHLCSADYIQRWSDILNMPLKQMAAAIVSDDDGWGTALRQNSPWVGEHA